MPQQRTTASGTVIKPELGEYHFEYVIFVKCKQCQKDASIGWVQGTGDTLFKCEHCGWTDEPAIKYDELIATIENSIASAND